jgi:hypothetical protein
MANRAARDLALRARAVLANPSAFCKYAVQFVKILEKDEWPMLKPSADFKPEMETDFPL